MRVLYAVLCEDAAMRDDGRVDLSGVFHHLYAPGFPAQQDAMTLVVVVEWDETVSGKVDFRIDLLDPARSPALTINGHTEVGCSGPHDPPQQTRLVMALERVVFPLAGSYHFQLEAAGEKTPITHLHLLQNPEE